MATKSGSGGFMKGKQTGGVYGSTKAPSNKLLVGPLSKRPSKSR